MATLFHSLIGRTAKLPTKLLQLFSGSPSTSSAPSTCHQFEGELKKFRRRMVRIQATLQDAEEREIREESVKLWLHQLRDVAYDADDVLDEVEYELLRHQLACEEAAHELRGIKGKHEVSDDSHHVTPATSPLLHDPSFQQEILAKINKINDLFHEIYEDGVMLQLHAGDRPRHSELLPTPRIPTTSLVLDEAGVRGREDDKRKVIGMLLSDGLSCDENSVCAVSIVGMGGVGKTTLAQLVFKDDAVVKHFPRRLWVCVSDSFDVTSLTKQFLEESNSGRSDAQSESFNSLQRRVHEGLQGKRFLLVLDDVWNENQEQWDALGVSLLGGAEGSRILITTRNGKVSRICRVSAAKMYRLGCLSSEDSWSLFEKRAFGGRGSSTEYPQLVPIGKEIVAKCKGLPLAVKTLAGLLFCEFREDRWDDVLRSEVWELPEGKDQILPALKLSYHHLPSPIKPCFAYCALFPKDHRFDRDELVRMWVAQGYIKPDKKHRMEDVGVRYFEDLLQRSFFQEKQGHWGRESYFVMHDLIHDLALFVSDGECCHVVDGKLPLSDRARHLHFDRLEDIKEFLSHISVRGDGLKRLRTCCFRVNQYGRGYYADFLKDLNDMFVRMKYLRVLDIRIVAEINELPDSVGNLKHLRYLSVREASLNRLPETLGNLLNLQTFNFSLFPMLGMPRGIGRLTQLRTLSRFAVVDEEMNGGAGIEELSSLNDLQGQLEIVVHSLKNNNGQVEESTGGGGGDGHEDDDNIYYGKDEAAACILKNKQGLESLTLRFHPYIGWSQSAAAESLLESLQPHTNIKVISILGYPGGRLPNWMGHPSYGRLEKIRLTYCGHCRTHLTAFGQLPALKELRLEDVVVSFRSLGTASFPSLEKLQLFDMRECEEERRLSIGTEGAGSSFPRLRVLKISHCPKLQCVNLQHLTSLKQLFIDDCPELLALDYYYNDDGDGVVLQIKGCPKLASSLLPVPLQLSQLEYSTGNLSLNTEALEREPDSTIDLEHCSEPPSSVPTSTSY